MNKRDINKVRKAILKHGDDFWTDRPEDKEMSGNEVLFNEILGLLGKEGLDLKLIQRTTPPGV
jgi:hypothetical protein